MAITLGTFTQLDDGVLTGTFKTLNVTTSLVIVPIEKTSDKLPITGSMPAPVTKSAPAGARSPNRAARPTSTSSVLSQKFV